MREYSDFTYVPGFTGYMKEIFLYIREHLSDQPRQALDIPAGSGVFAEKVEQLGHHVVKVDLHGNEGFVFANMEERLPFEDASFDFVTSMEGLEHVINPVDLLRELMRITRPGGHVVISTPNIVNLWSRLQFLFTGSFYQFGANGVRQPWGQMVDRNHISPFTPLHLCYVMGAFGAELADVRVDRAKKKVLMPLYWLMKPLVHVWTRKETRGARPDTYPGVKDIAALMTGGKLAFGRSQILVFRKREA